MPQNQLSNLLYKYTRFSLTSEGKSAWPLGFRCRTDSQLNVNESNPYYYVFKTMFMWLKQNFVKVLNLKPVHLGSLLGNTPAKIQSESLVSEARAKAEK